MVVMAARVGDGGLGVVDHVIAPSEPTRSSLVVLHTRVTVAPSVLAICTAAVPTPPEAPITRTCWPALWRPRSRSACRAVMADTGMAAACSKLRFVGIRASLSGCAGAYSANAALLVPYTASPGWGSVTLAP